MIELFNRFTEARFREYGDSVTHWLTFNEVDSIFRHPFTTAGLVEEQFEGLDMEQVCYQALHHQLVAAAVATTQMHELAPGGRMGYAHQDAALPAHLASGRPAVAFGVNRENHLASRRMPSANTPAGC